MIKLLYKIVKSSNSAYTSMERELPFFDLSYDDNTNFSSVANGKYKTYFKNFESVYPEPAYCIFGIIGDNKTLLTEMRLDYLHISMSAISSDGNIAVFQTVKKNYYVELSESLFLVNRQNSKVTEVIFEENYKTNNEALLGLEVFNEPNLIRRHYRGCYIDYDFNGKIQNKEDFEKYLYYNGNAKELVDYILFLLDSYSNNIDEIESKLNFLIGEIESIFHPQTTAFLYRRIGEVYQKKYDQGLDISKSLNKTLSYYRTALSLDPNVGIKTIFKKLTMISEQYE